MLVDDSLFPIVLDYTFPMVCMFVNIHKHVVHLPVFDFVCECLLTTHCFLDITLPRPLSRKQRRKRSVCVERWFCGQESCIHSYLSIHSSILFIELFSSLLRCTAASPSRACILCYGKTLSKPFPLPYVDAFVVTDNLNSCSKSFIAFYSLSTPKAVGPRPWGRCLCVTG